MGSQILSRRSQEPSIVGEFEAVLTELSLKGVWRRVDSEVDLWLALIISIFALPLLLDSFLPGVVGSWTFLHAVS